MKRLDTIVLGLLVASGALAPATAEAAPPRERVQAPAQVQESFVTLDWQGIQGEADKVGRTTGELESLRDAWLATRPHADAHLQVHADGFVTRSDLTVNTKLAKAIDSLWPKGARIEVRGETHHLTLQAGGYALRGVDFRVANGDAIVLGGGLSLTRVKLHVPQGGLYIGGAGTMAVIGSELRANGGIHLGARRLQLQASKVFVGEGRFTMQDKARVLLSSSLIEARDGFAAPHRSAMLMVGLSRISARSGALGFDAGGDLVCGSSQRAKGVSCSWENDAEVLVVNLFNGGTRVLPKRTNILTAEWDELIDSAYSPR